MKRIIGANWRSLLIICVILSVCAFLWVATGNPGSVQVLPVDGVWDLRGFDFSAGEALLVGPVEWVDGRLLTPDAFEAYGGARERGTVSKEAACATSRMTVLLDEGAYTLSRQSIDYAYRLYVNGQWVLDVGRPAETRADVEPDSRDISIAVLVEDGALEVVQQSANFWHREGGWHDGLRIALTGARGPLSGYDTALMVMGCFLALFVVHMTQHILSPGERASLFFSLFCLTWFLRTGVTGGKALASLLPWLSWIARFRIEYVALPVTGALLISLMDRLFPGVLPRRYRLVVYALMGGFAGVFLLADTLLMSRAMVVFYGVLVCLIAGLVAFFAARLRAIKPGQGIFLVGVSLFLYASIRDMFFYNGAALFPFVDADMSRVSMLAFALFQSAAVMIHTARRLREKDVLLAQAEARYEELLRREQAHVPVQPLARLSDYALAPRERELLLLLIDGKTRQQAADLLGLALGTVNTYCSRIYQKTGSDGLADLLRKFCSIQE